VFTDDFRISRRRKALLETHSQAREADDPTVPFYSSGEDQEENDPQDDRQVPRIDALRTPGEIHGSASFPIWGAVDPLVPDRSARLRTARRLMEQHRSPGAIPVASFCLQGGEGR